MTISAKVVSSKPAFTVNGPLIECSDRDDPGQRAAQREDDRSDEGRVDADEPRADFVLDHGPNATPERRHTEEDKERRTYRDRDHGGPDAPHCHRHADDRDRLPADEDVQRAGRVAPGEQTPDHERGAERQQKAQQRPLLAVLAVDGPHQRQVQEHGETRSRQHAHERRHDRRPTVLHDERDHDRREHHDLAVGEVEDAAETVDQRHPDAEQAEAEAEHDPVENDRPHTTPRYARCTSGFRSSSSDVPVRRIRPFSST